MNLTVFKGPFPSANLDKLLASTPLNHGSVLAVVPDYNSVLSIEKKIAGISGGSSFGVKAITFEGLSKAVISASIEPPEIIDAHLRKALLGEIVKSRISNRSIYSGISVYPGFITVVGHFLEDYRGAGNNTGTIDHELLSIIAAYESHLKRMNLTDHEGIVSLAADENIVQKFAAGFSGTIILDGFYDLTGCQLELITMLFKYISRCSVSLTVDETRKDLFALPLKLLDKYISIGAKIVVTDSPQVNSINKNIFTGFMGGKYSLSAESGKAEIHCFSGTNSEADWIAGTIRGLIDNGEYSAGDIMIFSAKPAQWDSPVYNSLVRYGVPVEGGIKKPLIVNPLVGFVMKAIDASIDPSEEKVTKISVSSFASGRKTAWYKEGNRPELAGWSCMISESDSPAGFVSSVKKMIEALGLPLCLDGGGDCIRAALEKAVYLAFLGALDEFASFYGIFRPMLKAIEFKGLLEKYISGISYKEYVPPGKGVIVGDANLARHTLRDAVFAFGLDNSSFPGRNAVFTLHDSETEKKFRQKKDSEQGILFYMSLYGAKDIYFCFPGLDDEGGTSSMSPFLAEIRKEMPGLVKTFFHAGVPGDSWEGGFATEKGRRENMVRFLRNAENPSGLLKIIGERDHEAALDIENAIKSRITMSEKKGLDIKETRSKEFLNSLYGSDKVFGVTDLETYIKCPIMFFFEKIMGVKKVFAFADGIDPGMRGNIIHDTLSAYYTFLAVNYGTEFNAGKYMESRQELFGSLETEFRKRIDDMKKFHPHVVNSEKRNIKKLLGTFHDNEYAYFQNFNYIPFLFEASFGSGDIPPLIVVHEDVSIRIKGRIDRIDVLNTPEGRAARVIDYKTGEIPNIKDIFKGYALQMPLYMKAAGEVLLKDTGVDEGIYYSITGAEFDAVKKNLSGCTIIGKDGDDFESIMSNTERSAVIAAEYIRNGFFSAPEKCESSCVFRTICREKQSESKENQFADPQS